MQRDVGGVILVMDRVTVGCRYQGVDGMDLDHGYIGSRAKGPFIDKIGEV